MSGFLRVWRVKTETTGIIPAFDEVVRHVPLCFYCIAKGKNIQPTVCVLRSTRFSFHSRV